MAKGGIMDYLIHYGVKGQKWGVRRYQNPDGSYMSGAEGRYSKSKQNATRVTNDKGPDISMKDKAIDFKNKALYATGLISTGLRVAGFFLSGPVGQGVVLASTITAVPGIANKIIESSIATGKAAVKTYKDLKVDEV